MLKTFKMKSGISVATYDLPNLRSAHLRLSCKSGSVMETSQTNGVAHLMEHLLVQGIPSLPTAEELSYFIEGLAGTYGAYTQQLLIGFDITLPAPYLETSVKIASEIFFEPLFASDALEKERGVVTEEVKQRMDSKYYKINEFFNRTRFSKGHPLTLEVGGSLPVVNKLTREDLTNYWQQYFIPQNTYITVVGNFTERQLNEALEKYFGSYNSKLNFPDFPVMSNNDLTRRGVHIRHDSNLQSDYVDLTFPALSMSDDLSLRMKQNLLLTILSKLRNSRLFKLLRYQKGLVYNVSASGSTLPGLGFIDISLEISPEKLEEVITLTAKEVETFVKNGPLEEELKFAKNFLINRWLMAFDHPSSIAGWIESDLLWEDEVKLPEEAAKVIEGVSALELIELMQKYWDFSKLNLSLQGPVENSSLNRKKYRQLLDELR